MRVYDVIYCVKRSLKNGNISNIIEGANLNQLDTEANSHSSTRDTEIRVQYPMASPVSSEQDNVPRGDTTNQLQQQLQLQPQQLNQMNSNMKQKEVNEEEYLHSGHLNGQLFDMHLNSMNKTNEKRRRGNKEEEEEEGRGSNKNMDEFQKKVMSSHDMVIGRGVNSNRREEWKELKSKHIDPVYHGTTTSDDVDHPFNDILKIHQFDQLLDFQDEDDGGTGGKINMCQNIEQNQKESQPENLDSEIYDKVVSSRTNLMEKNNSSSSTTSQPKKTSTTNQSSKKNEHNIKKLTPNRSRNTSKPSEFLKFMPTQRKWSDNKELRKNYNAMQQKQNKLLNSTNNIGTNYLNSSSHMKNDEHIPATISWDDPPTSYVKKR